MNDIELKKIGGKIYLFQESSSDPRGNPYMGPFSNPQEMEIFGLRVLLRAKKWAVKRAEKEEEARRQKAGEDSVGSSSR